MEAGEDINELDGVELVVDHSPTLTKGMRGAVVHDYAPHAPIVLVEFADENGETNEMTDIPRVSLKVYWKFKG
ncbi:MAG: DUF4926 domain-containing protein [Flavobacteriales bacterium]|jgi:hypothetical protein|nr:DUF4926 domain-containing protein [Flavobacteriales bacterium]